MSVMCLDRRGVRASSYDFEFDQAYFGRVTKIGMSVLHSNGGMNLRLLEASTIPNGSQFVVFVSISMVDSWLPTMTR